MYLTSKGSEGEESKGTRCYQRGLPGGGRPELRLGRTSRMCSTVHTRMKHTRRRVDLSSQWGVERSDWPEPNPVFRETVVRQIMDHRVGTRPISSAQPTDVFELEVILRTS